VILFGVCVHPIVPNPFFDYFPLFGANANTNQKEMNNGSKYYSTVSDSREKASISFFFSSYLSTAHTERRKHQ
jgi:hypothetical protein